MHALVTVGESFICALLAWSFQEKIPKKEAVFKVFCFFFKSFVAVAVTHNAANELYIVNSGDVM